MVQPLVYKCILKIFLTAVILIITSGCFLNAKIEGLASNIPAGVELSNNISVPVIIPDPINEKVATNFSSEGKMTWDLPSASVQSFKIVISKISLPSEKCSSADAITVSSLSKF